MALWAMQRNLTLSKHMSSLTFKDFSLQCESELEDWYTAKSKLNWNRPRTVLPKRAWSKLWSKIWDSESKAAESHFPWRANWKEDFWHLEGTGNLMLVDTCDYSEKCQVSRTWCKLVVEEPEAWTPSLKSLCLFRNLKMVFWVFEVYILDQSW